MKKIAVCLMVMAAALIVMAQQRTNSLRDRLNQRRNANRTQMANAGNALGVNALAGAAADEDRPKTVEELTPERNTNGVPTGVIWADAPVELILQSYSQQAGRTIIPDPEVVKEFYGDGKPGITFRMLKGQEYTNQEYLELLELLLSGVGVVLEPYEDKFIKALPRKTVRTKGVPINFTDIKRLQEKGKVVSQMIRFTNIPAGDMEKVFSTMKDESGVLLVLERINAILVTDTQENVNRMLEVTREMDVASPVLDEVFVRQIEFAVAEDICKILQEIVEESQKEQEQINKGGAKQTGAAGFSGNRPQPPPGGNSLLDRIRNNQQQQQQQAPRETVFTVSDADRGTIRGKVFLRADERSNKIIVITQKSNMDFFDKIIEQLDVETTPDVSVEVVRLRYAIAEDVSGMLNDLIGKTNSSDNSQPKTKAQAGQAGNRALTGGNNRSQQRQQNNRISTQAQSRLGELSKDNISVLADKRINAVVIMARTADMKAVKDVITDMDIKLSQVLIETVIVQVELGDDLQTGIDWVQRGRQRQWVDLVKGGQKQYYLQNSDGNLTSSYGPAGYSYTNKDGETFEASSTPVKVYKVVRDGFFNHNNYMLGGGAGTTAISGLFPKGNSSTGGGSSYDEDGEEVVATAASVAEASVNPIGSGINYYLKSDKLNLAAVLKAAKSDSRTKVLASPIIMTVDNQEAIIEATDTVYMFTGYQTSGSMYTSQPVPNYDPRDVGITVKVTPRINPNGTVVLKVEQKIEAQGADQPVDVVLDGQQMTARYATITKRNITSDISVDNRQTVVMGGLTKKTNVESESGIPFLKDIPYIGKWLFGEVQQSEKRSELLVFMTPYVLDDADEAQAEAARRKKSLSDMRPWDDNGWSTSKLADPMAKKEVLRRFKDEWARQDEERSTRLAIEKAKLDRAKKLKEMSEEERKFWFKIHEDELKEEAKEAEKRNADEQTQLKAVLEEIKQRHLGEAEREIQSASEQNK